MTGKWLWLVYEGFQDEIQIIGTFTDKKAAIAFAETRDGWNKNDPVHKSLWIHKVKQFKPA